MRKKKNMKNFWLKKSALSVAMISILKTGILLVFSAKYFNPCTAEPGDNLPLQTV